MTEHDPNAPLGQQVDPDTGEPLTRGRAIELLNETVEKVRVFVTDGADHWAENQDAMHLLAGLDSLHTTVHIVANALNILIAHDAAEDAIEEEIVKVTVPDVIPAEWLA